MSRAVLLINLGTPAEPTARGLRDFYRHFFADRFVFDINPLGLWLLRNLLILPFRAPRTARDYASIWLEAGSPLQVYSERVATAVQEKFAATGADVAVRIGMAYSKPFIAEALAALEREGRDEILVFPLFPQYATATNGSALHAVRKAASKWQNAPQLRHVENLFAEPAFIRAWAKRLRAALAEVQADHIVFSYHGLPESAIRKIDARGHCQFGACCEAITEANRKCYRAQCIATTRLIAEELGWERDHSVAFQSRFGRAEWIKPYLDRHLADLLNQGCKRVTVATPSFVTDCLETLHEIGVEYHEQFIEAGGEDLILLPNLNDSTDWIDAVHDIAADHLSRQPD